MSAVPAPSDRKTHADHWDPEFTDLTQAQAAKRVEQLVARQGWRRTMRLALERPRGLAELRVAEVGCGTGTSSLALGLAGAQVTLIDVNARALAAAKKTLSSFRCPAEFVEADCLKPPSERLRGGFDLAISGGLAEHFTGDYRRRCLAFHRELLAEGGVAVVGVPNRWSPFYWWIRSFRTLTGTWDLDIEVPYSNPELRRLGAEAGFSRTLVIGSEPLSRDCAVYARGFLSALVWLLPKSVRERARAWKRRKEESAVPEDAGAYIARITRGALDEARRLDAGPRLLTDWFSAGVDLVGFR